MHARTPPPTKTTSFRSAAAQAVVDGDIVTTVWCADLGCARCLQELDDADGNRAPARSRRVAVRMPRSTTKQP